jgi:TonB family protein
MLCQLAAICLALCVFGQPGSGKERFNEASPHGFLREETWLPFVPDGEEFAAMIPGPPTVLNETDNYIYRKDGERVLQHRDYSGYGNGLVFIIESYKVRRPQELMDALIEDNSRGEIEREFTVNGLAAKQHRVIQSRSYKKVFSFVVKDHVYFVTLIALSETSLAVDQFLSSWRIRTPQDPITKTLLSQSADATPDKTADTKGLTRSALVVWKPETGYTAKARAHRLTDTIILEANFEASGYVTNIKVIKGSKDGMTENAIEAARNIRFFPAQKDGKAISVHTKLEYNFGSF